MYNYQEIKPRLFSEQLQKQFLEIRDLAFRLCAVAGAVSMGKLFVPGDSWTSMACVDRLVELGELQELTGPDVAGQCRVFIRTEKL